MPGRTYAGRLNVENAGLLPWHPRPGPFRCGVRLDVLRDGRPVAASAVRHAVYPATRCHFVFDLEGPRGRNTARLELRLTPVHPMLPDVGGVLVFAGDIPILEAE